MIDYNIPLSILPWRLTTFSGQILNNPFVKFTDKDPVDGGRFNDLFDETQSSFIVLNLGDSLILIVGTFNLPLYILGYGCMIPLNSFNLSFIFFP